MRKLGFYISLLSILIGSCSKTDEDTPDLGYDYFPLITGNYVTYNVTEIIYDDFNNETIVSKYLLKEVVGKSFEDIEGRIVFELNRYVKEDTVSVIIWDEKDVWTTYKSSSHAERTEENVTFVKLTFPLRRSNTWDGNARNDSVDQIYTVINIDFKQQIGGVNFGRTSRINQLENINLIDEQFAEEIYAKDIGLVQKINRDVRINPADSSIVSGFDYRWIYKEHGVE